MSSSALALAASIASVSTCAPSTAPACSASAAGSTAGVAAGAGRLAGLGRSASAASTTRSAGARSVSSTCGQDVRRARAAAAPPRGPVTASMRRTFDALEPSERILNRPISAVERTCVPPHSSRE